MGADRWKVQRKPTQPNQTICFRFFLVLILGRELRRSADASGNSRGAPIVSRAINISNSHSLPIKARRRLLRAQNTDFPAHSSATTRGRRAVRGHTQCLSAFAHEELHASPVKHGFEKKCTCYSVKQNHYRLVGCTRLQKRLCNTAVGQRRYWAGAPNCNPRAAAEIVTHTLFSVI